MWGRRVHVCTILKFLVFSAPINRIRLFNAPPAENIQGLPRTGANVPVLSNYEKQIGITFKIRVTRPTFVTPLNFFSPKNHKLAF